MPESDELKTCSGVFLDIDGVVLNGGKPFPWSKEAIHTLWKEEIPFVFITNGTYCSETLVNTLTGIFDLPFTSNHCVVAPSPCMSLTEYHDKNVLVCCQNDSIKLISELGFKNYLTVDEFVEMFPELDYVDHERRKELLKMPITPEGQRKRDEFKKIDVILLLGEPVAWERSLQVLIDVLMTNGDPRKTFKYVPYPHIPLLACNKDLTFKGAAALPRFGHGAFLECLESLFMKITKNELVYEHLMGKPYLTTYHHATKQIQKLAKKGYRVNKFYFVGDNPDVDMKGANTFKEFLLTMNSRLLQKKLQLKSANMMNDLLAMNLDQDPVESILVSTGVYNPQSDMLVHLRNLFDRASTINSDLNNNKSDNADDDNANSLEERDQVGSLTDFDKADLKRALSRKNSFLGYFDDRMNIPDTMVNTVLDAVHHIVKKKEQEAN